VASPRPARTASPPNGEWGCSSGWYRDWRTIPRDKGRTRKLADRENCKASRYLSCSVSTRYTRVGSLDLHNQIPTSAREMSGAFFSGCLRKCVRAAFIRLVLSPAILSRARRLDEMSSRLIFLWLMRALINNSFLMKCSRERKREGDREREREWARKIRIISLFLRARARKRIGKVKLANGPS